MPIYTAKIKHRDLTALRLSNAGFLEQLSKARVLTPLLWSYTWERLYLWQTLSGLKLSNTQNISSLLLFCYIFRTEEFSKMFSVFKREKWQDHVICILSPHRHCPVLELGLGMDKQVRGLLNIKVSYFSLQSLPKPLPWIFS